MKKQAELAIAFVEFTNALTLVELHPTEENLRRAVDARNAMAAAHEECFRRSMARARKSLEVA